MENKSQSRRKFLQTAAIAAGSIPILSRILVDRAYAQAAPVLEETNPTAMALGYKQDGSQVDTTKFAKRAGPEGAKEFCHNCSFYSGQQKVEGKDGDWGKCVIFQQNLVNANGWCSSWSLKPGTTL